MLIKDLKTTKEFFTKHINQPIFGVGVWAFNRLGLEEVFSDYRLLCLRYSPDTELMEKDLKILSLEKGLTNKHLNVPRNSTSILRNEKTISYLKAFKNPLIIPYKSSSGMEAVCQEHGWRLGIAPTRFGKKMFENKAFFRRVLNELGVSVPPGLIIPFSQLTFELGQEKVGLPFVIQHPTRGGGKGTFFVYNREDFDSALKKLVKAPQSDEGEGARTEDIPNEVIIAKFIKGPSPSVTACATRQGILSTNLQQQVLDIPELFSPKKGSGLFCGHDWTTSDSLSHNLNQQANQIAQRVGYYFQKQGYQGIFGLDFIVDERAEKLYLVECNPRMTGVFPTLEMALVESGAPPLLAFHALEYLNADYELDVVAINKLLQQPKKGAHLFLHNLTERWAYNFGVLKPGVYTLVKNRPQFQRSGYKLQDLQASEEFLITEGVPTYKNYFSPNRRLCRILTKDAVLEKPGSLNPWARQVVGAVYKEFKIRPIRFAKIKKLFNKNFLIKG